MLNMLIEKATAFITAIIICLFNYNIIEPIHIENPDTTIIKNGPRHYESWGTHIISSYPELVAYSKINNSDKMKKFLSEFTPDFFIKNAIIIEDIKLSDSTQKTYITYINQINNELNLEYVRVNDEMGGFCAVCHDSVCVVVKKPITTVNVSENERMYLPFCSDNEFTPYFDIIEIRNEPDNTPKTYFIKNYDEWNSFLAYDLIDQKSIPQNINSEFFESKNLGIIITSIPDSSHEIRVADFNPYDKSLTVNYYSVSQPKIGVDMVSYYAIYIYADKTVESFSATKNVFSVPFNLDGSLPDK